MAEGGAAAAAAAASAAAAAAAAAIAKAIKASGTIVRVKPEDFRAILDRQTEPLVVLAEGGLLRTNYMYLTSYKGFAFYTKSSIALEMPGSCEIILSDKIWIP